MAFREKAGKFGMYLLCAAGGAAALFLLLRYLLPAFAPFIFSFILALILQKPVNFLEKKCRVPRALSSALLMLLLLGLLCRGIAALLAVLIRESADFISELTSGDADYLAEISALADKIGGAVDRIIRDNGRQRQYQKIFQLGKKTYGSRQHQNDPIKIKDGDYA